MAPTPTETETQIAEDIAGFTHDPLGYVLYAFPWGQGELADYAGPEEWQQEDLAWIGAQLKAQAAAGEYHPLRLAAAAGNGVGKSAMASFLITWGLSTCDDCRIIVTANTAAQLATKTWPELARWHRRSLNESWFEFNATSLSSKQPSHEKTWRADSLPWSINKPEAFAGLHNQGKRIIIIFDEASSIPDVIWETAEGATTDQGTEILWVAFGNPTRGSGRFHACFNSHRHLWRTRHIDSRNVRISNKALIQEWADTYGESSDYFKVHVKGEFPSVSDRQFIGTDLVEAARKRTIRPEDVSYAATILGCDPAWTGGDETTMFMRRGNYSKKLATFPKNDDDFEMAGYLAKHEDQEKADAVFVDLGYGTGIKSAGKQMGRDWRLVPFGGKSGDPGCLNKRVEMWALMKKWLQEGGAIPDDPVLAEELTSVEYGVIPTGPNAGKIFLESKEDMKKRGLRSPNRADALALTFAAPVVKKADHALLNNAGREMCVMEYDPMAGV